MKITGEDGHGQRRRLILPDGSTASAVIDLACQRSHPDHGAVVIWHTADPGFAPGAPAYLERLAVPPPGTRYSLACDDCPSTGITMLGTPDCTAGAFGVLHNPSCPWLRARLAGVA